MNFNITFDIEQLTLICTALNIVADGEFVINRDGGMVNIMHDTSSDCYLLLAYILREVNKND